jgi:hypothetical protein
VKKLARGTFPYSESETETAGSGYIRDLVLVRYCNSRDSQACHQVLLSLDALIFGCIVYTAGYANHSENEPLS